MTDISKFKKISIAVVSLIVFVIGSVLVYAKTPLFEETRAVNACVKHFAKSAHDPDSIEVGHSVVRKSPYYEQGYKVTLVLRGNNVFGAKVSNTVRCYTISPDYIDIKNTMKVN